MSETRRGNERGVESPTEVSNVFMNDWKKKLSQVVAIGWPIGMIGAAVSGLSGNIPLAIVLAGAAIGSLLTTNRIDRSNRSK